MSENPTYPDAHPTAPGGMSEKALVAELVETHGWAERVARALKWPEKIDAVCQERLNREREAKESRADIVLDVTPAQFADAVEQQHAGLMEAINGEGPESEFLRSMFSPEFLAEKEAETKAFVETLRANADAEQAEPDTEDPDDDFLSSLFAEVEEIQTTQKVASGKAERIFDRDDLHAMTKNELWRLCVRWGIDPNNRTIANLRSTLLDSAKNAAPFGSTAYAERRALAPYISGAQK